MSTKNPMILVKVSEPMVISVPCHEFCSYREYKQPRPPKALGFGRIMVKLPRSREPKDLLDQERWTVLPEALCWQCACLLVLSLKPEARNWNFLIQEENPRRWVLLEDMVCPRGKHQVTLWCLEWHLDQGVPELRCDRHGRVLVPARKEPL